MRYVVSFLMCINRCGQWSQIHFCQRKVNRELSYPDLLHLTKVISIQLLFASTAEYMLLFPALLELNLGCLMSDTLRLLLIFQQGSYLWKVVSSFESGYYSDFLCPKPHSFSLNSFLYVENQYGTQNTYKMLLLQLNFVINIFIIYLMSCTDMVLMRN